MLKWEVSYESESFMLEKSGKFCQKRVLKYLLKVWMNTSILNEWKGSFKTEGPANTKF